RFKIPVVLSHGPGSSTNRRSIVYRPRKRVAAANGDAFREALAQADGQGVQDRIAFRRFPDERTDAGNRQTARSAVWRAENVKVRAFASGVADASLDGPREIALHVEIPDLHGTEPVVRVDAVRIGRRSRLGSEQHRLERSRGTRAEHSVSDRERRLAGELLRDRLIGARVVVDAVAGPDDGSRLR